MAKAILESLLKEKGLSKSVSVDSAGLSPDGTKASSESRETIEHLLGSDILRNHRQKSVHDVNLKEFDFIFTMTKEQREDLVKEGASSDKTFILKEFAGYTDDIDVKDPHFYTGKSDWKEGYGNCAREIQQALQKCLDRMTRDKHL